MTVCSDWLRRKSYTDRETGWVKILSGRVRVLRRGLSVRLRRGM